VIIQKNQILCIFHLKYDKLHKYFKSKANLNKKKCIINNQITNKCYQSIKPLLRIELERCDKTYSSNYYFSKICKSQYL